MVVTLSPRYDTGLHWEKRYLVDAAKARTGAVEYEHYLYAGGLMFGKFIQNTAVDGVTIASTSYEYYTKDNLGSIVAITDQTGAVIQRLSYDVWGKRRYPNGSADPNGLLNNPDMYHGYTGHEMLDDVGLIHMNGRLYDPMMARFVSADFLIQSPDNLQSYNRYTYVWNNPLALTDPSGQWCIPCIVGAVVGALSAGSQSNWDPKAMVQGAVVGGLAGWAGGAAGGWASTASNSAIIGGIVGGATAGLVSGAMYSAMGYNVDIGKSMALGALAGGVAQGVVSGLGMPPMVGQLAGGAAVSYVTGENPLNGMARAYLATAVSTMAQMALESGEGTVQIHEKNQTMDNAPRDGQAHQFAVKPNSLSGRLLSIMGLGDPYSHYFMTDDKGNVYQATPKMQSSGVAVGNPLNELNGREYVMSKESFDPALLSNSGGKPYGLMGDRQVCTTYGRDVTGSKFYNLSPGQMIYNSNGMGGFRPGIISYDYSIYGAKKVR